MSELKVEATKQVHPLVVFRNYLQERADSLQSALPPHIKPERFISAVMTAVQINPDLLACERRSLWLACMRCAQDGLLPDAQEAAIVAYKSKAQYLPMYAGLLKRFRNSGNFRWVGTGIVYEGDTYEHWVTQDGEHFRHVPAEDNSGKKIRRVYALATTKDGGSFIADLSMAEIEKRRAMSRASRDDAPWKQWFEEMARKTALRVLSKLLPKSSDIDVFLQRDEAESLGVEPVETISDQRGAAFGNVLDHFAGTGEPETPPPMESGPEAAGEAQGEATPNPPRPAPTADKQSAVEAGGPVEVAYKRGAAWRTTGGERKAMPPEYRDLKHSREALAWGAGFDGKPIPTFSDEGEA